MRPALNWLWGIPIIGLAQIILMLGVALMFSTLNLFFRDLERFVSLGIMLLFYCTPILYSAEMIPQKYKWLIDYNPLASMILSWRELFMHNTLNYALVSEVYVYAAISLLIGSLVFNKLKHRFAEIL